MTYAESEFDVLAGNRLRQERLRWGYTQEQLAEFGGVRKQAQLKYEAGQNSPKWEYLALVHEHGIDVQFVITGTPSASRLASEEAEVLQRFRASSPQIRAAALAVLNAVGAAPTQVVSGNEHGQVVMGNQTNKAPLTFTVGGKHGKK